MDLQVWCWETGVKEYGMSELVQAQKRARPVVCNILRYHQDGIEDVLQSAALKAIKKRSQFRGESAFSTYFTRIAINTALMYLRTSAVKHRVNSISVDEVFDVVSKDESPEEFCIRTEREEEIKDKVWKAIDSLTPKRRSAARRWLEDAPISSNAEKSNRHHVRLILRKMTELKACL